MDITPQNRLLVYFLQFALIATAGHALYLGARTYARDATVIGSRLTTAGDAKGLADLHLNEQELFNEWLMGAWPLDTSIDKPPYDPNSKLPFNEDFREFVSDLVHKLRISLYNKTHKDVDIGHKAYLENQFWSEYQKNPDKGIKVSVKELINNEEPANESSVHGSAAFITFQPKPDRIGNCEKDGPLPCLSSATKSALYTLYSQVAGMIQPWTNGSDSSFYEYLSKRTGLSTEHHPWITLTKIYVTNTQGEKLNYPGRPPSQRAIGVTSPAIVNEKRPWQMAIDELIKVKEHNLSINEYVFTQGKPFKLNVDGFENCMLTNPYTDINKDHPVVRTLVCDLKTQDTLDGGGSQYFIGFDLVWSPRSEIQLHSKLNAIKDGGDKTQFLASTTETYPTYDEIRQYAYGSAGVLFLFIGCMIHYLPLSNFRRRYIIQSKLVDEIDPSSPSPPATESIVAEQINQTNQSSSLSLKAGKQFSLMGIGIDFTNSNDKKQVNKRVKSRTLSYQLSTKELYYKRYREIWQITIYSFDTYTWGGLKVNKAPSNKITWTFIKDYTQTAFDNIEIREQSGTLGLPHGINDEFAEALAKELIRNNVQKVQDINFEQAKIANRNNVLHETQRYRDARNFVECFRYSRFHFSDGISILSDICKSRTHQRGKICINFNYVAEIVERLDPEKVEPFLNQLLMFDITEGITRFIFFESQEHADQYLNATPGSPAHETTQRIAAFFTKIQGNAGYRCLLIDAKSLQISIPNLACLNFIVLCDGEDHISLEITRISSSLEIKPHHTNLELYLHGVASTRKADGIFYDLLFDDIDSHSPVLSIQPMALIKQSRTHQIPE